MEKKGRIKNEKLQKDITNGIDKLDEAIKESGKQIVNTLVDTAIEKVFDLMTKQKEDLKTKITEGKKDNGKKVKRPKTKK